MNCFVAFWISLTTAELGFGGIWEHIRSLYYDMTANPDLSSIWNGFVSAVSPLYKTIVTLAVVVCILIAFFGKKIKGLLTFVFFFVLGFTLGTHLLGPLIPDAVVIPAWVVGLVLAIVCAVLHRFLYYGFYAITIGYSIYILTYNLFYITKTVSFSVGKALICFGISVVCVIIAFIFRKYIEMVGTAALGAWLSTWIFANYIFAYNKVGFLIHVQWLAYLIPTLLIGVGGAIVQIKTRRRY